MDLNFGILASIVANIGKGLGIYKRSDPFTPDDLMPRYGRQKEPKEQSEYMEPGQILDAFDELIRRQRR